MTGFYLPLPFLTALLMALLAVRLTRAEAVEPVARGYFLALGGVFIAQALLVGLRFGYGIDQFIPVQRVLPFAIGPLTFLGFRRLIDPSRPPLGDGLRHGGPALALMIVCPLLPPLRPLLDFFILISMAGYGIGLARLYRRGPDGWPGIGLAAAAPVRLLMRVMLLFLAGESLIDGSIAVDFFYWEGRHAPGLIAVGNLGVIAALGWGLVHQPRPMRPPEPSPIPKATPDDADHAALLVALDALLADPALYGDPDLSLARLAKRLHVPARRVSEAINQCHGMNVSQYVNRARLLAAEPRLRHGSEPIGVVMESCGFRSKSNFNRECHRVLGGSPSAVRAGTV